MDYVEWVEQVFGAVMALDDRAMGRTSAMAIAAKLGWGEAIWDDFASRRDPKFEGLIDALTDLQIVGIEMPNIAQVTITPTARDVAHAGFRREVWELAFDVTLARSAEALLRAIVGRSVESGADFARLNEDTLLGAWTLAGADDPLDHHSPIRAITTAHALGHKGLVRGRWAGMTRQCGRRCSG